MKVEVVAKESFVTSYLVNDRYIVSHLYICEKEGPRGDVKVFDLVNDMELDGRFAGGKEERK